jgi:hypothetical protein
MQSLRIEWFCHRVCQIKDVLPNNEKTCYVLGAYGEGHSMTITGMNYGDTLLAVYALAQC